MGRKEWNMFPIAILGILSFITFLWTVYIPISKENDEQKLIGLVSLMIFISFLASLVALSIKSPRTIHSALGILFLLKLISKYLSISIHKTHYVHRLLSLELHSLNLEDLFITTDHSKSIFGYFNTFSNTSV